MDICRISYGGGKTEYSKLTIGIKDTLIISCNINDGEEYFTFNTDNNTFSGAIGDNVYKNSVNTSRFIRKTGEKTKLDETAQSLINAFVAGTMSESDLITKGFAFGKWTWFEDFSLDRKLDYYTDKLGMGHFTNSISSLIFDTKNKYKKNFAYTLRRVNVKSAEEMIAIANTIKTAERVDENPNRIYWDDNYYAYGMNEMQERGDISYCFTDEAKLKFEEAIKVALEERRLRKEREAEEKYREMMRKDVQPIIDYLVEQKTSTSISYDDRVSRYFDYTELDSRFWKLDLGKALKPFCKIVACKLVSCEKQGDTNVAVLDITKYNKKGNITYRVPVTIVKGKILVSSINFSNATVVE